MVRVRAHRRLRVRVKEHPRGPRIGARPATLRRTDRAMTHLLCWWLLRLGAQGVRAEEHTVVAPGWMLDRWTVDDGLPLDHVEDVAVDPNGVVWLATRDGLVRFDGVDVDVLRPGDPLGACRA